MNIKVDRNSKIPLYLQIKDAIKKFLLEGALVKNSRLPTENQLSTKLSISRNTVSMAYKELSLEGMISSIPGKGTFITDTYSIDPGIKWLNNTGLIDSIDLVIQKASEKNISTDDLIFLFNQRIKENMSFFQKVCIAFIECNQEQLYYFSQKIELGTGIHIVPIMIDEMYQYAERFLEQIEHVDLIVTTFFHFQEVQDFIRKTETNKRIIGIALDPLIETMVSIARITSPEMRVGLICLTSKFAERIIKSIKHAGIQFKSNIYTISHNRQELIDFISDKDVLIVSPGRKKEILDLMTKKIPLIEFIYVPDKGSINTLKKNIDDIKNKG